MNENKIVSICSEFCTGCGLCASVASVQMSQNEKGFLYPMLQKEHVEFCGKVCPAMGRALKDYTDGSIWGMFKSCWLGWSSNENVRFKASSGGVITTLSIYLLKNKIVDAIIQVKKDPDDPTKTINVVSKNAEDVLDCMGSRYTASSPLCNIKQCIEDGKKYAFIGKPCDASALRMYKNLHKEPWTEQIVYIFSFFCAGQPSRKANDRLLMSLGIENKDECADLQYRGNGWPGKARAWKKDGSSQSMDYETSWMKILGRDVRPCCRFCADGTGEQADISCGDAWYLTDDNRADIFTEHPGQNVIFARTQMGENLLNQTIKDGKISVTPFNPDIDLLHRRQPYHYTRKASLSSLKLAMKLCGRNFPDYDSKKLSMFAKGFPFKSKFLRFLGTIQRVWKKML